MAIFPSIALLALGQTIGPWWRHQMETFSALLAICAGNSPVTGEFPTQRPVTRSIDVFFFICAWMNNHEAGDLRRNRAPYYVTVMRMPVKGPWGAWVRYRSLHNHNTAQCASRAHNSEMYCRFQKSPAWIRLDTFKILTAKLIFYKPLE